MKIANQKTFEQFDKMRDQMFAHRKKEHLNKKQVKNPVSFKNRVLLPFLLIGGGFYLVYQNTPNLRDYLLQKKKISYQQSLLWQSLRMYSKCRWEQLLQHQGTTLNSRLANKCYITKLQSDYLYLNGKVPSKKIYIETKSKISFWVFGWNNIEKIKMINQYGDLVERNRSNKLMLGDFLRIWTSSKDTIIERDRVFGHYQKQQTNIANGCERMNWFNKIQLDEKQYNQVLNECKSQASEIRGKITKLIKQRLNAERKKKVEYGKKYQ